MTIMTVYDLGMPKYVYVQMYAKDGAPNAPIKIRADKFEESSSLMIIKIGNEKVGEFKSGSIAGWWIQDEDK